LKLIVRLKENGVSKLVSSAEGLLIILFIVPVVEAARIVVFIIVIVF